VWGELGRNGNAEQDSTTSDLAQYILIAVLAKAGKYPEVLKRELLLALDSVRAPAYAEHDVIEEFHLNYASQAAMHGYRAVWLVGPTAASTYQLF